MGLQHVYVVLAHEVASGAERPDVGLWVRRTREDAESFAREMNAPPSWLVTRRETREGAPDVSFFAAVVGRFDRGKVGIRDRKKRRPWRRETIA